MAEEIKRYRRKPPEVMAYIVEEPCQVYTVNGEKWAGLGMMVVRAVLPIHNEGGVTASTVIQESVGETTSLYVDVMDPELFRLLYEESPDDG